MPPDFVDLERAHVWNGHNVVHLPLDIHAVTIRNSSHQRTSIHQVVERCCKFATISG